MSTPALLFLSTLWSAGLPPGGHLVLAAKRGNGMVPEFFGSVKKAALRASELGKKSDVYVGMAAQPLLEIGRGETATALAIPGLWLDLDFEKGFKDLGGVRQFLASLPLRPSLLVSSGGGVHAHWLFEEYLACSPEDQTAAALELGWLRYCRTMAVAGFGEGVKLDAIADLARVLRVPGTKNFKRAPVVDVTLLDVSDARYRPEEFSQWRAEVGTRSARSSTATFDFALNENASPPFEKWRAATVNFPEIEAAFDHRNKMPVDDSLSARDLGLATRLDQMGWTAQEVVDTVIAHRRKWAHQIVDPARLRDPLHLSDPGYYERILRKARSSNDAGRASQAALELASEVVAELDETVGATPEPRLRGLWFRAVSDLVRVEVVELWAVDRFEGHWNLSVQCPESEVRDIKVSAPANLLSWQFWSSVIVSTGTSTDSIARKEPPKLRELMSKAGSILRVVGRGRLVRAAGKLAAYLLEVADKAKDFKSARILEGHPFTKVDNGSRGLKDWGEPLLCLFVKVESIQFDVKTGKCPPLADPVHALVELGFVPRAVRARSEDGTRATTRHYYCLPLARLQAWETGVADAEIKDEEADSDGLEAPN